MTGLDLSDFRIINPELATFSVSEIRVNLSTIVFNMATASELQYPSRICLLASDDGRQVAIKGCDENEFENVSIPFIDVNTFPKPKKIIIRDRQFTKALRASMEWNDKTGRKTCGLLYPKLRLILFDMSNAVKSSEKLCTAKSPSLQGYPKMQEVMTRLKPKVLALPVRSA